MIHKISTKGMSRDEWLQLRQKTIGGSDAAAIIGLSKWETSYSVWAEKTGRIAHTEDNEAMRTGRDLEEYVAKRFEEATGKKVRRENNVLYNDQFPFAHANIDRIVIGEKAGLECKTTSVLNLSKFQGGDYPDNYYVQCVHYLAVTELERWYLAVLVLGKGLYTYCIERNQAEIDALMAAEAEFYQYIEKDLAPEPDGLAATTEAIKAIYPNGNMMDEIDLTAVDEDVKAALALRNENNRLEEIKDGHCNRIKEYMREAAVGRIEGAKVTWKNQQRKGFNLERFQTEHPNMNLDKYFDVSNSRIFRITETKQREA